MVKKEVKNKSEMNLLLENSIVLQKTITKLAIELKTLNKKVSSMLDLFEDASEAFKQGGGIAVPAEMAGTEELVDKMDKLIKQNKTIAKGILLLEESFRKQKPEIKVKKAEYKAKPLPEFSF